MVCLTVYFVAVVYLQSSQSCVPVLAQQLPALWQSVPAKIRIHLFTSPHPQSHISSMTPPQTDVPATSFLYNNSDPSKLGLQSYSLPVAELPSRPSLGLVACTELEVETPKLAVCFLMCWSVVRQPGVVASCSRWSCLLAHRRQMPV